MNRKNKKDSFLALSLLEQITFENFAYTGLFNNGKQKILKT